MDECSAVWSQIPGKWKSNIHLPFSCFGFLNEVLWYFAARRLRVTCWKSEMVFIQATSQKPRCWLRT